MSIHTTENTSPSHGVEAAVQDSLWTRVTALHEAHLKKPSQLRAKAVAQREDLYQKIHEHALILVTALDFPDMHRAVTRAQPEAARAIASLPDTGWNRLHKDCATRSFLVRNITDAKRELCLVDAPRFDPAVLDWTLDEASMPEEGAYMFIESIVRDPNTDTLKQIDFFLHHGHISTRKATVTFGGEEYEAALSMTYAMSGLLSELLATQILDEVATQQLKPIAELRAYWDEVLLPDCVKEELVLQQALLSIGDPACGRGLLLQGPPGTGKTHLAHTFAAASGATFFQLSEADFRSTVIGGASKAVKEIWAQAAAAERAVIFLDECEGVMGRRGGVESDTGAAEALRTLLPLWDGETDNSHIFLIGATNRPELIDSAILSRFGVSVHLPLPDQTTRQAILRRALTSYELLPDLSSSEQTRLGRETVGLSGRDLYTVAMQFRRQYIGRVATLSELIALIRRFRTAENTQVDSRADWGRLVVPADVKETLQDVAFALQHSAQVARTAFKIPTAILLAGPAGTGKTQCARTLANEARVHFIVSSTADLKAPFVGQSGLRVKQLFEKARTHAPCILFLDEIDAIASSRDGTSSDTFGTEALNQMLQELDGICSHPGAPVVLIAATNRKDALDPALLSRFRETLDVPLPDRAQRLQLLDILLAQIAITPASRAALVEWIASDDAAQSSEPKRAAVGISHRDIDQLVHKVLGHAMRRVRKARVNWRMVGWMTQWNWKRKRKRLLSPSPLSLWMLLLLLVIVAAS